MSDELDWGLLVGDLKDRHERALAMGGPDRVERQRRLGRCRFGSGSTSFDPGTWVEYGMLADHMDASLGDRYLAADGCVRGMERSTAGGWP